MAANPPKQTLVRRQRYRNWSKPLCGRGTSRFYRGHSAGHRSRSKGWRVLQHFAQGRRHEYFSGAAASSSAPTTAIILIIKNSPTNRSFSRCWNSFATGTFTASPARTSSRSLIHGNRSCAVSAQNNLPCITNPCSPSDWSSPFSCCSQRDWPRGNSSRSNPPARRSARPFGPKHILQLIVTTERYLPTLHRAPGKDRFRIDLLAIAIADPSQQQTFTLLRQQQAERALTPMTKILGADGDVVDSGAGPFVVNFKTGRIAREADLRKANPGWNYSSARPNRNSPTAFVAVSPTGVRRMRFSAETLKATACPPPPQIGDGGTGAKIASRTACARAV